jgi:hypothetical protein
MPGLAPSGVKIPLPEQPRPAATGTVVELTEGADNGTVIDIKTGASITKNDDGSISVDLSPTDPSAPRKSSSKFDENLADGVISETALTSLANDLLEAFQVDMASRREFMENLATGITLLGLKIELPSSGGDQSATPVEGMSTVRSPILLESVTKFQSNARGEILPASGPVKVKIDGDEDTETQVLADDLERQMNHYLTVTCSEYVPDTDRMLFWIGFAGSSFKKIFHCPIRRRVVSDTISSQDLVVNNTAVDLNTAGRVTQIIKMRTNIVRRMQKAGAYRKVDLQQPNDEVTVVQREASEVTGIRPEAQLPKDIEHTILEMYVDLDLSEYDSQYEEKMGMEGIALPYRVTVEKDSYKVLEIRRNWKPKDKRCLARRRFVKFGFIPSIGFYDIGLLHLLGNTTLAMTAVRQELIDAGQFSNFPGFLYARIMGRQNSNQFRVPPGGGAPIDTNGQSLRDSVIPLPYKGPDQTLVNLAAAIESEAQRLGGTAEIQVGEGSQTPVGTTLALIEQATKVISAVHKRLHAAQAEEFRLIRELLIEDPDCLFIDQPDSPKRNAVVAALGNMQLVPAADPNVPSHMHRLLLAQGLFQMAQAAPNLFNLPAVAKRIMRILGISDIESILNPNPGGGDQPKPQDIAKAKELELKAKGIQEQAEAREAAAQDRHEDVMEESKQRALDRDSRERVAAARVVSQERINEQQQQSKGLGQPDNQQAQGFLQRLFGGRL